MSLRSYFAAALGACVLFALTSCAAVRQADTASAAADADTARIIATSPAVTAIADKLEMPLVGVPSSTLTPTPARYKNVKQVGGAMSPDMEIVKSLRPDWVLSPDSLISDLKPKYQKAGLNSAFLDLRSVAGMYKSIEQLGDLFDRKTQAKALINEYDRFYTDYRNKNAGRPRPKVLVLMGLPGSYIIATENSYVGSLVKMAGGENVYQGTSDEFLNVNTEELNKKDPDIILRAAHALPDEVVEMFKKDFATNDIWKHFRAVQQGKVYDLNYKNFGMSANFNYPNALADLQTYFYGEGTAN